MSVNRIDTGGCAHDSPLRTSGVQALRSSVSNNVLINVVFPVPCPPTINRLNFAGALLFFKLILRATSTARLDASGLSVAVCSTPGKWLFWPCARLYWTGTKGEEEWCLEPVTPPDTPIPLCMLGETRKLRGIVEALYPLYPLALEVGRGSKPLREA